LVESRPCNWVIALTGWMPNCLGGNDSIFYLNQRLTFFKNGEEDWNMPLKNFTETKMGCQNHRESRMGSWLNLVWIVHGQ